MSTKKSVSKPVSKPAKAAAPKVVCTVEESDASETGRHFEFFDAKLDAKEFLGRVKGRTPKSAGNNAFSSILARRTEKGISTKGKIHFSIRETTRGSKHKVSFYEGERMKLDEPVVITDKNGNTRTFKFINKLYVDKEATKKNKEKA